MSVFETLHPRLRELLKQVGIISPTAAQERSLGHILKGEHTLLLAPTGIGKTEAAAIPVFESLIREGVPASENRGFRVIYTTPLRALNRDIISRLRKWGEYLGIRVGLRHGDTPRSERTRQSRDPPDFLITTPETFQILFTGSRLIEHLRTVRYVIMDEVHDICGNLRGAQLSVVLERLERITRHPPVRVGLSATVRMDSVIEVATFLGGMGRSVKVERIETGKEMQLTVVTPRSAPGQKALEAELACTGEELESILTSLELMKEAQPVLFFVNTRQTAEVLASRIALIDPDFPVGIHHGSLSKEVRTSMEDDFKGGALKGLICTSSLELGIDVGFVKHVIQFSSPREVTRLVQRIGRAGHRVGEISMGQVLATRPDDIMESGVIVRRAVSGELETIRAVRNPLAVLSNQIIASTMESGRKMHKGMDEAFFEIVKRSYPFSTLEKGLYYRLLDELSKLGLIRWDPDSGELSRRKRAMDYFYDNISMIRDEKVYRIIDIATRRSIGTLDEEFVSAYLGDGVKFIMRGRAWVVVEMSGESILVSPGDDIGAIPSWIGEEIPVPFDVAQEVGRAREALCSALERNEGEKIAALEAFRAGYQMSEAALERYVDYIREQTKVGVVPISNTILVEREGSTVVINTCFGTRCNETLSLLLSSLLASRLGRGLETSTDAYRIVLEVPHTLSTNILVELLTTIVPGDVERILSVVLKNSSRARGYFVYMAKKFGAIRKDADIGSVNLGYLARSYGDSLILEETIARVLEDYLDTESLAKVFLGIRDGTMEVLTATGLSPISLEGLDDRASVMSPYKADSTVLEALRSRLLKQSVILVCMNCGKFSHKTVADIPERGHNECWNCGGTYLAVLHDHELERISLLKKDRNTMTAKERKQLDRFFASASIVAEHGRKGVMTLMGRGIGPRRAIRILPQPFEFEEDFLREILRAEIEYARTRQFWD